MTSTAASTCTGPTGTHKPRTSTGRCDACGAPTNIVLRPVVVDAVTLTADLSARMLLGSANGVDQYADATLLAGEVVSLMLTHDGSDWGIGYRGRAYVAAPAVVMAATAHTDEEVEAAVVDARRRGLI